MQFTAIAEELVESACPAIAYRTRTELLGEPASSPSLASLVDQIIHGEAVQHRLAIQEVDGWIGRDFHGYDSMEAAIRVLCEHGLDRRYPPLAQALTALNAATDRLYLGIGKPGRILDETGHGGSFLIRASLLAQAGDTDNPHVREQIPGALAAFESVLDFQSLLEATETWRGKPVFQANVTWPSIYHLRLLAFTSPWRTPEGILLITRAVQRLVALSPMPAVYVRQGASLVAPASFGMQEFNPQIESLNAAGWLTWFQRMELLARLGVIPRVPALQAQVEALREMLALNGGRFTLPLAHAYFRQWGAYTGLMLERDWKIPRRREHDLTFRSLLIWHYASSQPA